MKKKVIRVYVVMVFSFELSLSLIPMMMLFVI